MRTPELRNVVTLTLLLTGALVSSYVVIDGWENEERQEKPELSLAYYLDSAELIGTGPDGKILYQVWTKSAAQSVGDNSIQLNDVEMRYRPPNGLAWELNSRRGRIPADADTIELIDNVVARSRDTDKNFTTITTSRLDINPATRLATTDQPVSIDYNGRKINATGMRANFEKNQLSLLSNVNGKFLP